MTNFQIIRETDEEKAEYYNQAAAHQRRETINEQIDKFFASGGKIEKLPAYDEGGKHD